MTVEAVDSMGRQQHQSPHARGDRLGDEPGDARLAVRARLPAGLHDIGGGDAVERLDQVAGSSRSMGMSPLLRDAVRTGRPAARRRRAMRRPVLPVPPRMRMFCMPSENSTYAETIHGRTSMMHL
jgi:hypothetical protein